MSHNIFGSRFAGKREPAWHGLGDVFTDAPTMTEALTRIDGLFEVIKVPIEVEAFGQKFNTGRFALVRQPVQGDDQPRYFGDVSDLYECVQNRDLAAMLDPITERWPVETVGCLGVGETLFATLDAGTIEIKGDEVHQFYLVTDTKAANGRLRIAVEDVRVVCENTLNMALGQALVQTQLTHVRGINERAAWHVGMIEKMDFALGRVVEAMQTLARTDIDHATAVAIIEATYPLPVKEEAVAMFESIATFLRDNKDSWTDEHREKIAEQRTYASAAAKFLAETKRVENYRDAAVWCYDKLCDEYPKVGGTAWAIYNAIVEVEDYREGTNAVKDAESAIFGQRAKVKERAFNETMRLATA